MAFDFQDWYVSVTQHDVVLSHGGTITSELVTKTLDEVEGILIENGLDKKKVKRAYNAIVEGLQNLYHHAINAPGGELNQKFGAFCFKIRNNEIEIITGNYVIYDVVPLIKDRIDQINMLSEDDLKELYKKILSNQEFSDKGGGGLGMVDIAKRTGSKLLYSFFEYDEKYAFFELKINV